MRVDVGDGASMPAPDPDLEWTARYAGVDHVAANRFKFAEIVAAYNYLINSCNRDEAWRRIKLLRAAVATKSNS